MTTLRARPATAATHVLAEGPVWDADRGLVHWVDIDLGEVLTGVLEDGRVRVTDRLQVDRTVGAVVPSRDGRLLVAGRTSLYVVGTDRAIRPVVPVLPDTDDRRLNDGACDPDGHFLVGSLSLGGPSTDEVLCRWEDDGSVTTLDTDLQLSNGLAWSPDGRLLYSVDTLPGRIWVRDYSTDVVGPRREHLRIDGFPDGICTDSEGNLWVAVWGTGQVRCYAEDGGLLHTVEVPAPHTSAVAFAGPELDTLLITTASAELDPAQRARYPLSGALFTARVGTLGVHGAPTTPWNGQAPADHHPSHPEV